MKAKKRQNEQNAKPQKAKTKNHIPAADRKQKTAHRQRIRSKAGNLPTITTDQTQPETITPTETTPGNRHDFPKPSRKSYPQSTRTAPTNFPKNYPSISQNSKKFQKIFGRSGDAKNIGGYQKALHYIFAHAQNFSKNFPESATATKQPGYKIFLQTSQIMQTDAITTHYSLTDADRWGIPKSCAVMQPQMT